MKREWWFQNLLRWKIRNTTKNNGSNSNDEISAHFSCYLTNWSSKQSCSLSKVVGRFIEFRCRTEDRCDYCVNYIDTQRKKKALPLPLFTSRHVLFLFSFCIIIPPYGIVFSLFLQSFRLGVTSDEWRYIIPPAEFNIDFMIEILVFYVCVWVLHALTMMNAILIISYHISWFIRC